jgi:hypothetical protein
MSLDNILYTLARNNKETIDEIILKDGNGNDNHKTYIKKLLDIYSSIEPKTDLVYKGDKADVFADKIADLFLSVTGNNQDRKGHVKNAILYILGKDRSELLEPKFNISDDEDSCLSSAIIHSFDKSNIIDMEIEDINTITMKDIAKLMVKIAETEGLKYVQNTTNAGANSLTYFVERNQANQYNQDNQDNIIKIILPDWKNQHKKYKPQSLSSDYRKTSDIFEIIINLMLCNVVNECKNFSKIYKIYLGKHKTINDEDGYIIIIEFNKLGNTVADLFYKSKGTNEAGELKDISELAYNNILCKLIKLSREAYHKLSFVHCDAKPENIMISTCNVDDIEQNKFDIYYIDFGLSFLREPIKHYNIIGYYPQDCVSGSDICFYISYCYLVIYNRNIISYSKKWFNLYNTFCGLHMYTEDILGEVILREFISNNLKPKKEILEKTLISKIYNSEDELNRFLSNSSNMKSFISPNKIYDLYQDSFQYMGYVLPIDVLSEISILIKHPNIPIITIENSNNNPKLGNNGNNVRVSDLDTNLLIPPKRPTLQYKLFDQIAKDPILAGGANIKNINRKSKRSNTKSKRHTKSKNKNNKTKREFNKNKNKKHKKSTKRNSRKSRNSRKIQNKKFKN